MPIRHNLPPITALLVLEAAARHRSFTSAAVELKVTQAAISRQIAALEEELQLSLFVRKHRAVEPTPACLMLASTLSTCLAQIAETVETVRTTAHQKSVTIGATLAFTTFWLLPRLGEFRHQHPHAQIRVVSQDGRIPANSGDVDVVVRFGVAPFDDGIVIASREDEVFPVCSPEYAARMKAHGWALTSPECDLIGHDVPSRSWFDWSDWFDRAGMPGRRMQPALRFSHYAEALQSARAGHGMALGWGVLMQQQLDEGALVRWGDSVVTAEGRYNLVVPPRAKHHPLRDTFIDWLTSSLCLQPAAEPKAVDASAPNGP